MKKTTLLLAAMLAIFTGWAQKTWKADPYHSYVGFEVKHLGIAVVPGNFGKFDVSLIASKDDFSDAVLEFSAETNSIHTRVEPRDNHLRSADFFDVEKYPTMNFKSTSIKKVGKDKYELTGNLTLHGVTRTVTVEMEYEGTTQNPNAKGAPVAGFEFEAKIKRSDFNLGNGFPAPMISDEVEIVAHGEFGVKS